MKKIASRVDLGGWVGVLDRMPEIRKKMRDYNMLTWPQNAGTPISEDLNLKKFPGEDAPAPPLQGNRL